MTTLNNALVARNGFMNFKATNTKNIRKGFGKVRSGTGNTRWAFLGESNTAACGAGTGPNATVDCRKNSYSAQFAKLMNSSVIPCHEDSAIGLVGPLDTGDLGDSRVVFGAGWVHSAASLGGPTMNNATTTNPLSITPINGVDTFKLWYIQFSGNDTVNVTIDASAPATGGSTINANGASSVQSKTFTASSVGSHTFSIARTAVGAGFSVIGWEAWDSTKSMVSVINCGIAGAKAGDIAAPPGSPWVSLSMIGTLAADVHVLWEGSNDATAISNSTETIATYTTNMQTIINKCQLSGDVILGVMAPTDASAASFAAQTAIRNAQYSLALQYDIPLFDVNNLLIDYTTSNALGFQFSTVHQNIAGYSQIGGLLFNAIRTGMPAV